VFSNTPKIGKKMTVANLSSANNTCYKVLICDLIGMKLDDKNQADFSEVEKYIIAKGGTFHIGAVNEQRTLEAGKVHFFYQPQLSRKQEILEQSADGQFDACIAAATFIPATAKFKFGAVRIGAGTGNMGSDSWGGGNGLGGHAALMNTPSFNSRATAQSAFKALLKVMPDLNTTRMHELVVNGEFDTGKDLASYPCTKLEGKRLAVIGYGNIGREVAKLGAAFGMQVIVFARERHKKWIESEGFDYAATITQAATKADVISPHTGLGVLTNGRYANADLLNEVVFSAMNKGAVLVNYDRGEVVDIEALDQALMTGQISYAAIDADVFIDPTSGTINGPMQPYRKIYPKHQGKMELLPHAAADTEHVSRVEGAKQAVDQIFDCILNQQICNLVGELPEGFTNKGAKTVPGIGKVTPQDFSQLSPQTLNELTTSAINMAEFWQAMHDCQNGEQRSTLIKAQASGFLLQSNTHQQLLRAFGLQGPFEQ